MGLIEDLLVVLRALVQGELRALQRGVMRTSTAIALLLVCVVFIALGVVFLAWGLYLLFAWALNPIWGAFLTAASMLLIGIVFALIARSLTRAK